MPTLLEVQQAMHGSLMTGDDATMTAFLADPAAADRINIYRNTFLVVLTKALQLCYPVVLRLVGPEFFEGAARQFITRHPPREAYLDRYGADFPAFLRQFPPAASLPYLADVAALEWAVNAALHSVDVRPLDLQELAALPPDEQGRLRLAGHPSIRLLRLDYPVNSLEAPAWRFAERLFAGDPIEVALDASPGFDASAALADHLASGRFVSFELAARDGAGRTHP